MSILVDGHNLILKNGQQRRWPKVNDLLLIELLFGQLCWALVISVGHLTFNTIN